MKAQFCWLALVVFTAATARAQGPGIVTGTVRSGPSQVADAPVFLDGGRETRTDSTGTFRFRNVRVGVHTIEVRSLGKAPVSFPVEIRGDDTVRAEIDLEKITALEGMLTEGNTVRMAFARAYEDRKKLGFGKFIDSAQVRSFALVPQAVSFTPGVQYKNGTLSFNTGTGSCRPHVWIDRVSWGTDQGVLKTMSPSDVVAIEVYTRGAPDEFTPRGTSRGCGALVIWTKRLWPDGKGK